MIRNLARQYPVGFAISVLFHIVLVVLIVVQWSKPVPVGDGAIEVEVIEGTLIDTKALEAQKKVAEEKRKAEEAARKAAEEKRKVEEARKKAETEAARKAKEQAAKEKAAKKKAEAEAKLKKEAELKAKVEVEEKRKAEEARKKAEAEAARKAKEQAEKEKADKIAKEKAAAEKAAADKAAKEKVAKAAAQKRKHAGQLDAYRRAIQQAVRRNWRMPGEVPPGAGCKVNVRQATSGLIVSKKLSCTGGAVFERSVAQAIERTGKLPSPPTRDVFQKNVEFTFDPSR